MHEADVYLNGEQLLKHKGGYLPFVVDLSDKLQFDEENVLLIRLINRDNPTIPPGKPIESLDFNYFSGIYRNAYLLIDDKLHISDPIAADRVAAGGLLINYTQVSDSSATVNVQTDIANYYNSEQKGVLRTVIENKQGTIVAEHELESGMIPADSSNIIEQQLLITNPTLWSPDRPYLYDLTVELRRNGKVIDAKQKRIGIRTISFNDDNQFVLNGKVLRLRGTNRHQSYPYIGYALSDNAQYRDAYKIKKAGFNFIRTAHYPPSPAFLQACDELGILFMNAIPGWQFFGDEEFQKLAFRDIRHMIRRDRNHPSIAIWEASLNESEMDKAFMDKANHIVHEELPFENVYSSGWIDYGYDIFIPARQHAEPPTYWNDYGMDKPYFIAEYGDWEYYAQNAGFNQDDFEDLQKEERTSRQLRADGQIRLAQQALNFQEAHNSDLRGASFGDANWVMFDYNRGYASNIEASGIADIFRIPKFSYYFYQSQAGPYLQNDTKFGNPMIYIATFWSDPSYTSVKIYSDTEEVELFLNGKFLGRRRPDSGRISTYLKHPPFTFEVDTFEPGTLRAVGYINGEQIVNTTRFTPGQPYGLHVDTDISGKKLEAGKKDIIFVHASVVDKDGVVIPTANNSLKFTVEGNAEIIGQNPIEAEAGIATVLLRAGDIKGEIEMTVDAEGVKSGRSKIIVN